MISNTQFRELLYTILEPIRLWSEDAEELLVATMAHESLGGTYIIEIGRGFDTTPSYGIFDMQTKTHDSLINALGASKIFQICTLCGFKELPHAEEMAWNMKYAILMARHYYLTFKEPLPAADDINAIWNYYKQFWNTSAGSAIQAEFIEHYNQFIGRAS